LKCTSVIRHNLRAAGDGAKAEMKRKRGTLFGLPTAYTGLYTNLLKATVRGLTTKHSEAYDMSLYEEAVKRVGTALGSLTIIPDSK
jgi:hypothetical protein